MSLNYLEINQVLKELSLKGAYLQNIHQPELTKLVLHFFKQKPLNLLICLNAQEVRLHQTWKKYKNPTTPPRFVQLLRSRLRGSQLLEIKQIENNRIVKLYFQKHQQSYFLWLRLWTNQANIILCDSQNKIIDCFFRKPAKNEISGQIWNPPPTVNQAHKKYQLHFNSSLNYSQQLEAFYEEKIKEIQEEKKHESYKKVLLQLSEDTQKGLKRLQEEIVQNHHQSEEFKLWSNLLFTYQPQIYPQEKIVTIESYHIPIRNFISAKSLAQNFLGEYKKLKEKNKYQESKAQEMQEKLSRYQLALKELEMKTKLPVDFAQKYKIVLKKTPSTPVKKKTTATVGLKFNSSGFTITIGRNAKENDKLLRHHAKSQDMWLHLRDFPGCYAFISYQKGKTYPLEVLLDAASLALYFTHKKKINSADFYYTLVKNLRRAKGAKIGTVIPYKEKNLHLTLKEERLAKFFNTKEVLF